MWWRKKIRLNMVIQALSYEVLMKSHQELKLKYRQIRPILIHLFIFKAIFP